MAKVRKELKEDQEGPENNGVNFDYMVGREVPRPDLLQEGLEVQIKTEDASLVDSEISKIRRGLGVEEDVPASSLANEMVRILVREGDEKTAKFLRERWERNVDENTRQTIGNILELISKQKELLDRARISNQILDRTVEATSGIIDSNSPWTADHSLRLTLFTDSIAQGIGDYPLAYRKRLHQAGLLHDIGKIPLGKLIDKIGFLTPEERKKIQGHASLGHELLEPALGPAIAAGTSHHEKWNGMGYTEGLVGHETPVISRLLEASDIQDALLSFRPYKQGKTPEASMAILEEETGSYIHKRSGKIEGADLDPIITAQVMEMYEGRDARFKDYFRPEALEEQVRGEFAVADPYTKDNVTRLVRESEFELESLVWGDSHGPNGAGFDVYDLEHSLRHFDKKKAALLKTKLEQRVKELETLDEKLRQINANALFLLVNSVEVRSQGGESDEQLKKARQRTENRVYYSLMQAQRMGLSEEDQRKVILGSLFATLGMMAVPENKFASTKDIGIKEFADFEKVPKVGYELLQYLTKDPELSEQFEGVDIGARDLYKWYDGEGGYGVGDKKSSTIGQIISIAHKYVARRASTPHRDYDMGMETAMVEMRKGVGTEFDPKIFVHWEQLYAEDQLRGYIRRPEMVEIVRKAVGHTILDILPDDEVFKELASFADKAVSAKNPRDKLTACLEGATLAKQYSRHNQMERFVDIGQEVALQLKDLGAINKMIALYNYDLANTLEDSEVDIDARLRRGTLQGVIAAKGVLVNLIQDYAEKQQFLSDEIIVKSRNDILVQYRMQANALLEKYKDAIATNDVEGLKKVQEQVERATKDLGDADFAQQAETAKKEGLAGRALNKIQAGLVTLTEMLAEDALADPWEAEHLLAGARRELRLNSELIPKDEQKRLQKKFGVFEFKMRQRGYMTIFRKFRKASNEGKPKLAEELALETYRWIKDLPEGADTIGRQRIRQIMANARRNGVKKNLEFLQAEDLSLEDVPLVSRWRKNIIEWQDKLYNLDTDPDRQSEDREDETELLQEPQVDSAVVTAMAHNAYLRIMNNLSKELPAWLDGANEIELKRLLLILKEYVVENRDISFPIESKTQADGHINGIGQKIYEVFMRRANNMANDGRESELAIQVGFFEKFCHEKTDWGEELRIALTDEQRSALHRVQVLGYSKSIDIHLDNIANASHARSERFRAEVKDLQLLWEKLVGVEPKSLEVMRASYQNKLNLAIQRNFASAIGRDVQTGDYAALSDSVLNMYDLREQNWVEEDEEEGQDSGKGASVPPLVIDPDILIPRELKDLSIPTLLKGGREAAGAGDAGMYLACRKSVKLLGGKWLGRDWDMAAFQEILVLSEAKVRLLGAKSHIVEMRKEMDLVMEFAKEIGVSESEALKSIMATGDELATSMVETYRIMLERNNFAGSLMAIPHAKNVDWVAKLINRLVNETKSGKEDASYLAYELASVV